MLNAMPYRGYLQRAWISTRAMSIAGVGGGRLTVRCQATRKCFVCGEDDSRDHMLLVCGGWSRVYWDPQGPGNSADRRHRLQHEEEVWKTYRANQFERGGPLGRDFALKMDAARQDPTDVQTRWKVFNPTWDDCYYFLLANPAACTFEFSDLVAQAEIDRDAGKTSANSLAIAKVLYHTRRRRVARRDAGLIANRSEWLGIVRAEKQRKKEGLPARRSNC